MLVFPRFRNTNSIYATNIIILTNRLNANHALNNTEPSKPFNCTWNLMPTTSSFAHSAPNNFIHSQNYLHTWNKFMNQQPKAHSYAKNAVKHVPPKAPLRTISMCIVRKNLSSAIYAQRPSKVYRDLRRIKTRIMERNTFVRIVDFSWIPKLRWKCIWLSIRMRNNSNANFAVMNIRGQRLWR